MAEATGRRRAATLIVDPVEYWCQLDRQGRTLAASLAASLALHALILSLHFRLPGSGRITPPPSLEVILVNARSLERPTRPEALAQANLDGGGTVEAPRRARTPLPAIEPPRRGQDLAQAERRAQELEVREQELLAQAREAQRAVTEKDPAPAAPAVPSGRELADLALAAARLQAEIDRRHEEYQKRPRKRFIGARATEYRFALYEEQWRAKIERVGTLNFPADARGKLYGSLRLTVTLRPDGSVESVELDRSSGLKALDEAAFRIVRLAAPFAPFPPDVARDTDLLVITRTWFFAQGDRLWTGE